MIVEEGISVVISTYSKALKDQVLDCIYSLQNQTFLPNEILLILDHDPDLIRFFRSIVPKEVKILSSNGFGLSNARNAGVRYSKSEIIAFIDDDAVADRNWLKNIFRNYSEPKVAGVGGLVVPLYEESKSFDWFPEELNWIIGCSYKGLSNKWEAVRNPIGCNMSFRSSVFEKVGYFKNDVGRLGKVLLDGEEPEFCNRVHLKLPDAKIMNDPSAVVLHKVSSKRMTFKYLWKRSFYQGYSKALINDTFVSTSLPLDKERNYLNFLATSSVLSRLKRFYRLKDLSQLTTLFISSLLVLFGFVVGKVRKAVD